MEGTYSHPFTAEQIDKVMNDTSNYKKALDSHVSDSLRYYQEDVASDNNSKDCILTKEYKDAAKEGGYKFNEDAYLKFKYRLFSESDISPIWDRIDGSKGKHMKAYANSALRGMRKSLIATLSGRATRVPYLNNIEEKLAYIDWRLN